MFTNGEKTEKGHLGKYIKNDLEGREIMSKLCDDYLKNKLPGKTVIFTPSHEFCEMVFDILKEKGRKPAYLALGLDDVTRKNVLESFEKGDCDELINVDICTEGYDYPELANLVDLDTNGTHGQWVQKVGRVLRTAPGKVKCLVMDFGGNVDLYPDGVETDVNLEGAVKNPKGRKLTEDDFFKKRKSAEKVTAQVMDQYDEVFTPYHLPDGFETVNDADFGIVTVACGEKTDCLLVKHNEAYRLLMGDKNSLKSIFEGSFDVCMAQAVKYVGKTTKEDKPISRMQIKLLAPEYPTSALDWYGANCCICWKTWKSTIKEML